jgi:hypothetical protein
MNIKEGYKVLRINFPLEGLRSYFINCTKGSVVYKLGEWVKPNENCGPLAVFNNLESAKKFIGAIIITFRHVLIYKCKYVPSKRKNLWVLYGNSVRTVRGPVFFPKGTVLANKVMITEEIK